MKKSVLGVILALILIGAGVWYFTRPFDFATFDSGKGPCPGQRVKFTVPDPQMSEYVAPGTVVDVIMNYYACNAPKVGDLVLYRFSRDHRPVVKRVAAAPGDTFSVHDDSESKRWTLKVNGEPIEWNGGPYFFGVSSATPPLKLSEVQMKGELPSDSTILLSGHPPGLFDSGMYGAVKVADVIGKVDLPETRKPEARPSEASIEASPAASPHMKRKK